MLNYKYNSSFGYFRYVQTYCYENDIQRPYFPLSTFLFPPK